MLGPLEYLAGAAVAASLAFGGYQTIRAERAVSDALRASQGERVAKGELQTCAARLENIKEAAESNASIPDDLHDFDIPSHWMQPGADPAGD